MYRFGHYQTISAFCTKVFTTFPKLNRYTRRFASKPKIIDNVVFIDDTENNGQLQISFKYRINGMSTSKRIIFHRNGDDTVDASIKRMKLKLYKAANRRKHSIDVDEEAETLALRLEDRMSGRPIIDVTWNELIPDMQNVRMKLEDNEYDLAYNYPIVEKIALPAIATVGFDLYPSNIKFNIGIDDMSNCHFTWYQQWKKGKWKKCERENSTSFFYRCQQDDIDFQMKIVCEMHYKGLVTSTASSNIAIVIADDKIIKNLVEIEARHQYTATRLPSDQFRIISYNLLADFYTDSEYSRTVLFPYCDASYLAIDYRKKLFVKELMGYNCDLMCLQEVDENLFEHDFTLYFRQINLLGVYLKKWGTQEGLATFYNADKFSLVANHSIVLGEALKNMAHFRKLYESIKLNDDFYEKFTELRNIAQVLLFKPNSTGNNNKNNHLLIVNTHLSAQIGAHNVRLIQAGCILIHIEHLINTMKHANDIQNFSVVICGDFNSQPMNAIHQLMTTGYISDEHNEFRNEEFSVKNVHLSHAIPLKSAYEGVQYTNYTDKFTAVLDYIYYQCDNLRPIQTVPLPDVKVLAENVGIPSGNFPSDHLALVSDFEWTDNDDRKTNISAKMATEPSNWTRFGKYLQKMTRKVTKLI